MARSGLLPRQGLGSDRNYGLQGEEGGVGTGRNTTTAINAETAVTADSARHEGGRKSRSIRSYVVSVF